MSKSLNIRLNDDLKSKIDDVIKEENITVTELTKKAITEYIKRRNMQTISFPIDVMNIEELDMIYNSLSALHQILLNNYNTCNYIDELNQNDLGVNVEQTIRNVGEVLINISKVKRSKNRCYKWG